jgi:hypothetical protein
LGLLAGVPEGGFVQGPGQPTEISNKLLSGHFFACVILCFTVFVWLMYADVMNCLAGLIVSCSDKNTNESF